MSDPFVAEIRIVSFNFAPTGWAQCDGQIMPISQNTALFSLLGTMYGGDGKSTFALPDFQGRVPMHHGQGQGLSLYDPGQAGGTEYVTLIQSEIPFHTHNVVPGSGGPPLADPSSAALGPSAARPWATTGSPPGTMMSPQAVAVAGSSLPHNNMPPYLALNFIIALQGIFPARN